MCIRDRCRFNFPKDIKGFTGIRTDDEARQFINLDPTFFDDFPKNIKGFHAEQDENGRYINLAPFYDEFGNLKPPTSEYTDEELELMRNHKDLVSHIPELLIIWNANTDQKTITSYHQLLQYLLKYIMKAETPSEFFSKVATLITEKLDDDDPLNKVAQKVLMNALGKRDMSKSECFVIAHNLPYVKYSLTPRVVNLMGACKVKDQFTDGDESILDNSNWQEAYWNRSKFKPKY